MDNKKVTTEELLAFQKGEDRAKEKEYIDISDVGERLKTVCNDCPNELAPIVPQYQRIANPVLYLLNWLYNQVDKLSDLTTLSLAKGVRHDL